MRNAAHAVIAYNIFLHKNKTVKVNSSLRRAFTVLLGGKQKMEGEERVEKEGHADKWEVICLGEIANLSGGAWG